MSNFHSQTSNQEENLRKKLDHIRKELDILYQISTAMRTTLKLEEILYIILTGVTSHEGLGFNRAALFLVDDSRRIIEGKMGIGPDTGEEADKIWQAIEKDRMSLEDLIENFRARKIKEPRWKNLISNFKSSYSQEAGVIFQVIADKTPLLLKKEQIAAIKNDPLVYLFNNEELVIVPLLAKEKPIGLIAADNFITRKPITTETIRLLSTFANQAGLAIENSKLYESILLQSQKDSLTNLYNHGYFQDKLQEMLENEIPLTFLMMDVDDFKIFNDTFGHRSGDRVLKQIAKALIDSARKQDLIARYGGEEFAVILPFIDKNEGSIIAERIRKNVENTEVDKKITISIGLSSSPVDSLDKEEIIEYADRALYKAKREGKNKVCTHLPKI